ncbi:MAG TPA: hypothetical protein VGY54_24455, partial [Polyangiaceae bacterium]|nr:hypothetical protein [Polyangiaceae bacterium]
NARDFGERVETAKPFVRERVLKQSGKAASDAPVAPSAAEPQGSVLAAAVVDTSAPAAPQADSPPVPVAALPDTPASIKVLSGLNAGVSIPLRKAETTVGRPGVQVASIVRSGAYFKLQPLEGISPPAVNGEPVGKDGAELARGDVIEIAGTRLEFVDGESI